MLKKILSILVLTAIILSLSIPAFAATLDSVSATLDSDNTVTISGKISSGGGKQVTVKVADPEGDLDYVNQIESGTDGSFEFTYELDNTYEGTYQVTVNGEDVSSASNSTFVYTYDDDGDDDDNDNDNGGSTSKSTKTKTKTPTPTQTPTPTSETITDTSANIKTFNDIAGYDWAKEAIEALASKGIINGTTDTTFDPSKNIKRADFMLLLVRAFDLQADVDSNFDDVDSSAYYYNALGIAKKLGIASGVGDGMFNPEGEITRQDMMVLVVRTLDILGTPVSSASAEDIASFDDAPEVTGYATESVAGLVKDGIIKGSGNNINPKGTATRAEIAVIIYRLLNR